MKKRIIGMGVLIVTIAVFGFALGLKGFEAYASTDTEGPVVHTLKLDKTKVSPGDTLKLTAEITDESEIYNYVFASFKGVSTSKIITMYHSSGNKYVGTLDVTSDFQNGEYTFDYISVRDVVGNFTRDASFTGLKFSVFNDVYGPEYVDGSLSISEKSISPGDSISIKASFTDYSKIKSIIVDYEMPQTKTTESIALSSSGKDYYTGTFKPKEYAQSGTWKIKQISATDIRGNERVIKNSKLSSGVDAIDLSVGDFVVTGTTSDTKGPEIERASIRTNGGGDIATDENFHVTLNATDALSGVKAVYINYTKPDGNSFVLVLNKSKSSGKEYFGSIPYQLSGDPYLESLDLGAWDAVSLVAEDNAGNSTEIKDKNRELSFTFYHEKDRIQRIANATVYKENAYISYETIQGDVYIGPNAVVTLENITVTGNIYVLGGAKLINVTASGVYGSSMSFGYSYGESYYNGMIYFTGFNSINTMVSSSTPVKDIPVEIVGGEATSLNGKLRIKGSTLDIADFYIADNKIDISDEGKFVIKDIDIGDANQVSLKWKTVFGNTIEKIVNVTKLELDKDGNINYKPVLNASDITVCIGQKIDLRKNAKAKDHEDGDISRLITISPKTVATDVSKQTKVKYTVADSKGSKVEKIVTVTVKNHDWVKRNPIVESCTKNTIIEYSCRNCKSTKNETIKAKGHIFGSWNVIKDPTVDSEGVKEHICKTCGASEREAIPKLSSSGNPTDVNPQGTPPSAPGQPGFNSAKQRGVDGTALGKGASAAVAEAAITAMKNDNDLPGSVFNKLQFKSSKQTKTSVTLSWKKVSKAKTYVIYGNKCGKKNRMKRLAKATRKTKKIKKLLGKKIKKGTYYKFMIVALDKNKNVVSSSKVVHVATKGGKVGNVGKVKTKAKKNKTVIKKGKTFKLKGKQIPAKKKLKVKKHRAIKYESTNTKIATVNKKGVVKGKKKGKCYVFVYSQNGVFAKIKITVKKK